MSNIAEPGLLGLAWIVTAPEPPNEHVQTAFAIDARYVYRRETDLSEALPRPKYYRAEHREVLATDDAWDSARFWEQCDETGEPWGQTYGVRVTFEHLCIVRAADPEAAKARALRRLNLPERLRRDVRAVVTLLPPVR